ncbi:MAG: 2,3-bisphosphoglycerate-independent phosphoglycerate mutase [Candidatus Marinimicrobia bacterium]|nr:2,3-bisphosphoglycerate-independent phosphoglycerate mutase [Candidatus Neomarinimicrobiota bacterium]
MRDLCRPNASKIVLVVLDGLGGIPLVPGGLTELETAATPALDTLAAEGITGLHVPVRPGITPGSGPGHLGILGYDPLAFTIGRGALAAAGMACDLQPGDVAARGNFCTVDEDGLVTDRRAGRIDTGENKRLCRILQQIEIDGVDVFVDTIKEHRFLLVLRGSGLSAGVTDTDPQTTQVEPRPPKPVHPEAHKTADCVLRFVESAQKLLAEESSANMVLLRGFAGRPTWPSFGDVFGVHSAAIAGYPMYRGIARLLGMEVLAQANTIEDSISLVRNNLPGFDFFFVHVKATDSTGEDGDFEAKVRAIEKADEAVSALRAMNPDVLVVTGDHSTPARLRAHSWHPVPALLWAPHCRPDGVTAFGERACLAGALGLRFPATDLMPLALAHAGRLNKFGA